MMALCTLYAAPSMAYGEDDRSRFVLGTASSLCKIFPDVAADSWIHAGRHASVSISAARRESESTQVIVIPRATVQNLQVRVDAPEGLGVVSVSRVGYVNVPTSSIRLVSYPADQLRLGEWPDPLLPADPLEELPARRVQPYWITVQVAPDAPAGDHVATLHFTADDAAPAVAEITITVRDFELPDRTTLKTTYWYDDRNSRSYWRNEFNADSWKPLVQRALDNRITPVYLQWPENIVHISYDSASGRYDFDLSAFEQRLAYILDEAALKGNAFNVLEHHYKVGFTAKITVDGQLTDVRLDPMTPDMEVFLTQYLAAWKEFLEPRGWSQYAYIGFCDEPQPKHWDAIRWLSDICRREAPQWPIVSAIGLSLESAYPQGVGESIDILVPHLQFALSPDLRHYQRLVRDGRDVWGYVCSQSSNIDFEGIDHRIWFWISRKYGLSGSLYWGLNFWGYERPNHGAYNHPNMFITDPSMRWPYEDVWQPGSSVSGDAGDGYLMYPSPDGKEVWSSIRLECIRDGIEDYEYFAILQRLIQDTEHRNNIDPQMLKQAKALLAVGADVVASPLQYTRNTSVLETHRQALADAIERLSAAVRGDAQ